MKFVKRILVFCPLLVCSLTQLVAATVTWDGGGGNSSWETAANWSSNVLPGVSDDVVITGSGEIVYSSGNTSVRSLQSSRGLTINGGTLNLTAGPSSVQGALKLQGGTFSIRGVGTSFTAAGTISNTGGSVYAREGASVTLSTLTKVAADKAGHILFAAYDPGSVLNLPNLTEAGAQNFYQFQLQAFDGAQLNAPKLTNIVGAVGVVVDGPNAQVDLSGFSGTLRNTSSGSARVEARNGGAVLAPNVTA